MKKMIFKRTLSLILLICMALTSEPARLLAEELSNDAGQQEETRQIEVGDYRISISRDESGEETAVIDRYLGNDEHITVPDTIGGYPVTGIGSEAFHNDSIYRTEILSVDLPEGITFIGNGAFDTCTSLTEITIPDSVTEIRERSFYQCGLTKIAIPDNVTSIGREAFFHCFSLADVVISESVTEIGGGAFDGTEWLDRQKQENEWIIINGILIDTKDDLDGVVTIPDNVTSIGDGAFSWCALTNVTIPNSVTSIGGSAFYCCEYLENITIPDSVTSIGDIAFYSCGSLKTITIPDSVASIGKSAFQRCSSLTEIKIPANVTEIESETFSGCTALEEIAIPGNVTTIGDGAFSDCQALKTVAIPDSVTSIGEGAFRSCSVLEEIVLPKNLTSIGDYALSGCSALTSVTIPDSVASIGESVFRDCSALEEITLPNNLASIGANAFSSSGLTSVTLPDGMATIGEYAFSGCSALTSVTISDSVTSIGESAFRDCSSLEEITLPNHLASIGANAFSGSGLTSVTLPDGMTTVGEYALSGCSALTSVTLPDSVTSIGESAFRDCSSLEEITLPNHLASIGANAFSGSGLTSVTLPDGMTTIGDYALSGCSALTSVTLPDSVASIGESAFRDCSSLEEITLPNHLASIGANAFSGSGLTSVTLPNGMTTIGDYALSGCSALTSVTIPNNVASIGESTFRDCSALEEITLPNHLASIGAYAFFGSSLTSVTIPDGMTTIGYHAFSGCSALTSVTIPDSVTSIEGAAFENCSALEEIAIPNSVASIGSCVFSGSGLTTVTLPNGMTSIRDYALSYCSALKRVMIPDSVTTIGTCAFEDCSALEEITLPNNLTTIGAFAFRNCSALEGITLPNNLTSIGEHAFSGSRLTRVMLPDNMTTIGEYVFSGCSALTNVTIPDSVTAIGEYAFECCSALTNVTIPNSVTTIGEYAFFDSGLTRVTLPDNMTTIGDYSFHYCLSLTEIMIPESVTTIGKAAFCQCTSLTEIMIPDSVTTIGESAFSHCSALTNITIPDSVTTIGYSAFSGCSSLTSVMIPDSVTSVGGGAFYDCPELKELFLPDNIEFIGEGAFERGEGFETYEELVLSVVPGSYAEQYATEHEIPYKYYVDESIASVRVTLSPDEGLDLQGLLLTIKNNDYQTSRRLTYDMQYRFGGVLVGDGYTVEVSNDYGDIFSKLENVSVQAGINQLELKEFAVPSVVNACVLSDGGEDMTNRCVIEWLDGEGNNYASGASLRMIPAGKRLVCRVRLDEELSAMYEIPKDTAWTASVSNSDLEIRLNPLQAEGAVLNILAEYTARTDDGYAPEPKLVESLSGMSFSIVNETSGMAISRYIIQGSSLILPENVNAGDTVTITVSSRTKDFAQASQTVVMESDNHADAEFSLMQFGALKASYQNGKNSSVRLLIYDENGSLAWTGASQKSEDLQSNSLPDGNYTALVMGNSKFMAYPDTLQGISDFDLKEGNDYIARSVTIRTGKNTASSFGKIPVFDEERFYVSNPEQTQFSLNKTQASVGNYVSLRATAPLKPEYEGRVSDVKWIFKIPEQCELISGTLSANGESCCDVAYEENEIAVSSVNSEDIIRMCLLPLEMGSYELSGALQYTLNGKTVRQPVGQLTLSVDEASITLPKKTMSTHVTVSGTAISPSAVSIYDNGELAGQTSAGKNGRWSVDFDLLNPYTYSEHDIYAEVETPTGEIFRTEMQTLTYQYVEQPAYTNRVTMVNQFHDSEENVVSFDFQGNNISETYYNYDPRYPSFTFIVEMAGDELEKYSNVQLFVSCSDDNVRTLYPSFDKNKKQWVTSEKFYSNALPKSVSVSYDYDADVVHSAQAQEEIYRQWTTFYTFIRKKDLKINPSADCPDDVKKNLEDYNKAIDKAADSVKKLQKRASYKQDETSVSIETENMKFESRDISDTLPSDAQLSSDGYKKAPSTSPDHSVHTKNTGGSDGESQKQETVIKTKDKDGNTKATKTTVTIKNLDQAMADADQITKNAEQCNEDLLAAQKAVASAKAAIDAKYAYEVTTATYSHLVENKEFLDVVTKSPKIAADLPNLQKLGKVLSVVNIGRGICDYNKNNDTIKILRKISQDNCEKSGNDCKCMNKLIRDFCSYQILKLGNIAYSSVGLFAKATPIGFAVGLGISTADYFWGVSLNKEASELNGRCKPCQCCNQDLDPNDPAFQNLYNGASATGIIDPSGYVYEAVPSNRLSGVTASCYEKVTEYDEYGEPRETEELWDAVPYEQMNPLVTKEDGSYAWDVPQGIWQVRYEKEGYEPAASEWMEVPPPRFDVNVGLISREAPAIADFAAYPDELYVAFNKYVQTGAATAEAIKFYVSGKEISGRLLPLDEEASPEDGTMLASKFSFVLDETLAKGDDVDVSVTTEISTYAGVNPAQALAASAKVVLKPESLAATQELTLAYGGEGTLELSASPANAVAGMEVSIANRSPMLAELPSDKAVLDANGKASIPVKALLPGQCVVEFTLKGSSLTAQSNITIQNPDEKSSDPGEKDDPVKLLDLSACKAELEYISCVYDGTPKCPSVTVMQGTSKLQNGTDYAVAYTGNTNAGTAYAVISGKGAYNGSITLPFVIQKAQGSITAADMKKTVSSKKQSFSIKASCAGGGKLTYKSSSKSVKVNANGTVTVAKNFIGKAVIAISAEASENYTGAHKNVTLTVNPAGVKLSKITEQGKGKIKVTWKKSKKADGYEIQYALTQNFRGSSAKIKQVKKKSAASCVISKLKKGKTYYVRIRTYKKAAGKKYVSDWSGKKKLRKKH